jgi:anti-sigma factor RsiW
MAEPTHEHEHGYTCKEVVELATEYVDGVLSPQSATLFELHLNFCDGCMTFIDQIRTTAATAAQLCEDEVPEETKAQLLTAFREWRRA